MSAQTEEKPASAGTGAGSPSDSFFSTLITANHILHKNGIVDAYGHISARNPRNPDTFFLSASVAPALVSSRNDILEYRVSDGEPVSNPDNRRGYVERYIHSEIYKKYKDVMSVVHAHAEPVLPFTITAVPLRPVFHMGGIMGPHAPLFDIARHYQNSDRQDLLVSSERLGAALAAGMTPESLVGKAKNFLWGTDQNGAATSPSSPVILMRGHGFTAVGDSIEQVVYRSIYTVSNARIQLQASLLNGSYNTGLLAPSGRDSGPPAPAHVYHLSEREVRDTTEGLAPNAKRPWQLWVHEVELSDLYTNEYQNKSKATGKALVDA